MEVFFENQIYVIFGLIIYYLLMNDKPAKDSQKMIVVYIFIAMLAIFNILDIKYMLIIMLLCLFVYLEFLIDDEYKHKIIRKLRYKFVDFVYLVVSKFHIIEFTLCLFLVSNRFEKLIEMPVWSKILLFSLVLIYILGKLDNDDFELYSFTDIYKKINEINFNDFSKISEYKEYILTGIEDRSFFIRENDYTFLCWNFIKYRLNRIEEIILKVQEKKNEKNKIMYIFRFIWYVLKQLVNQIRDLKQNFKKFWRGYSTIEMQLFRTVAIKNGYKKVFQRKITELIYAQLFFKGLKDYYKLNYQTVSSGYYKKFIMANYLAVAPIMTGGKNKLIQDFWNKKPSELTNEEFFLTILCLSGKLKKRKFNYNYIVKNYSYYITVLGIKKTKLRGAVKKMENLF